MQEFRDWQKEVRLRRLEHYQCNREDKPCNQTKSWRTEKEIEKERVRKAEAEAEAAREKKHLEEVGIVGMGRSFWASESSLSCDANHWNTHNNKSMEQHSPDNNRCDTQFGTAVEHNEECTLDDVV